MKASPSSRVSRIAVKEPCTVIEELHRTKTKAIKTVSIRCYSLWAKYSTYCLFFAQLILSTVLLERYCYHSFAERKTEAEELTEDFPISTKMAKKLDL